MASVAGRSYRFGWGRNGSFVATFCVALAQARRTDPARERQGLVQRSAKKGKAREKGGGGARAKKEAVSQKAALRLRDIEDLVDDGDESLSSLGALETAFATGATSATGATLEVGGLEYGWIPPVVPRYNDVRRSLPRLFPFVPEPSYRSFAGNTAGDAGFDPLGLCSDVRSFVSYREAELKHGRLAMVAAIVWPLVEIEEPIISQRYRLPDALAENGGRFLPTFTGGLQDQFVEGILVLMLVIGASCEIVRPDRAVPGDIGADPLRLEKWRPPSILRRLVPPGRPWMPEAEVKHGRLAMVAFVFNIIDELTTGNPTVEETEYFFHRLDVNLFRWEYWLNAPTDLASGPIDV